VGAIDLVGARFGLLTVTRRIANNASGSAVWECLCDCGSVRAHAGTSLRTGRLKSCGCASPRFTKERLTTHGKSRTRTYKIWAGMIARCSLPSKKSHLYFGKGIRVCERWQKFDDFYADMGDAPDGLTIERIDGSADYSPDNCCWATRKTQANNTTRNKVIHYAGEKKTVAQWAEYLGIKPNTLLYRFRRGWSAERALNVTIRRMFE
jgi:hypothetical protein